jgi:thiol-disulfide isomerase/thioredoxin
MRTMTGFMMAVVFAAGPAATETQLHRLAVGTTRPRLDFRLLDGKPGPRWEELRGQVVIADFWATWCAPCVASIPHMNELRRALAGEPVRFFAITYEPQRKVREFLGKHPIETPIAIDNDLSTFSSFVAWGIPMAVVLDREGKVVAVVSPRDLTPESIRTVLAGKAPDLPPHPGWDDPAGAAKYFREQLEQDRAKYGHD